MHHNLKCDPAMFDRVADGSKTFEVRRDDRGFQSGDTVTLWRFDRERCRIRHGIDREDDRSKCPAMYPRQSMTFTIGFVFKQGFGCDLGQYVVLSLTPCEAES